METHYMFWDCDSIFKENHTKPLMLPLLHFQRSRSEGHCDERAGRGLAVCPEDILSAVVWVSLTERPICCHFCWYKQSPLKREVLHNTI